MRAYAVVSVALAILAATGCASSKGPIIDTKGVDMTHYEQDLAECEEYSKQVNPAQGVAKGAAGGAAVGGAIGAIAGGGAGRGAGIGAVGGAARSAQMADEERRGVVKNCLRGRGYKVLN